MVNATTKLTGQGEKQLRFDALDFNNEFDGLWACASLLDIARQELNAILSRITKALKPGGVLYLSFKHGDCERASYDHVDFAYAVFLACPFRDRPD